MTQAAGEAGRRGTQDLALIALAHLAYAAATLLLTVRAIFPAALAVVAGIALYAAGATGLYLATSERRGPGLLLAAASSTLTAAIVGGFAAATGARAALAVAAAALAAAALAAAAGSWLTARTLSLGEGLGETWSLLEALSHLSAASIAAGGAVPPVAKIAVDLAAALLLVAAPRYKA